jgi:hydroxymethylpyrimidine kinase/phosphomethylpyrimidine kinase/thiamine-phosphate diphosphorylase
MISGLYLITDDNRDGKVLDKVKAALIGGARIIQYRAKHTRPDERRGIAEQLRSLCQEHKALLIINDFPELAREIDADGVHLGQGDMPPAQARQILGRDKLIGISTHSVEEALKAEAQGADYIAFGSIFPTSTKEDTTLVGLKNLSKVRKAVRIPLVAIGGITPEGASQAIDAGADAVAVITGIMADDYPGRAAREYALLFNRHKTLPRGKVMTIAGSDSGGGAGIQADIKTITLLGSYASSVLTSLTAQNTLGVNNIYNVHTDFVLQQLDAVLDDISTDTVKTGMLNWGGIVWRVARVLEEKHLLAVVDPVMVAKGGAPLLDQEAQDSLISRLLPQAYLLTPNLPEITAMTGMTPETTSQIIEAGRTLQSLGARNVLLKGGHLQGDEATDILLIGEQEHRFTSPRINTPNTHGTGCTLSAAIATFLAQGFPLKQAVERAKRFISIAIEHAVPIGHGHGPINHFHAAMQLLHEKAPMD